MIEKPKIQYIGQFYVHGSAAQKVEPKKQFRIPKTQLPLFRPNRAQVRYVEPVAIAGMVLAVALLVVMVCGMLQLKQDWAEYTFMSNRLADLRQENHELRQEFRAAYDMADVEAKAIGMGMVPADSVTAMTITVTAPDRTPVEEPTWSEEVTAFWQGLWA